MAKIPFVVAPRLQPVKEYIGSEDSGKIEIERKGYLTAGERSFMQANSAEEDLLSSILGLSRQVGKEFSVDMKAAYDLVMKAVTSEESEDSTKVWDKFSDELNSLAAKMLRQETTKKILKAYCLLLYRVNSEVEMQEVFELHEDIIEGLVELFDNEEGKSTERLLQGLNADVDEVVEEGIEDIEKK